MKKSKHSMFHALVGVRVAGGAGTTRQNTAAKVDRSAQIDAIFARLHSSTDFTLDHALEDYANVTRAGIK